MIHLSETFEEKAVKLAREIIKSGKFKIVYSKTPTGYLFNYLGTYIEFPSISEGYEFGARVLELASLYSDY